MMEWEQIDDFHQRSRVFGGWLVKSFENVVHVITDEEYNVRTYQGYDFRVAMAFVPDPDYEWILYKKSDDKEIK